MLEPILDRMAVKPTVPLAIEGNPGQGKTAIIENYAEVHGLPMVKLLASTLDETDVAGIIIHNKEANTADTISPKWYQALKPDNGHNGRGILLLDEFNTARKEVMDTMLTLVHSRHLPNGDTLGDGVMIIAAMNEAKQCDNYEMSPAMRTRFMWSKHNMKPREWHRWLMGKSPGRRNTGVLPGYVTFKEWLNWFHADNSHDADKKALINESLKLGLKFDTGQDIVDKQLPTTARGLTNLLYWSSDAADMCRIAGAFVDTVTVTLLQSIKVEAYQNAGNELFKQRAKKEGSVEEQVKIQQSAAIHQKIQAAVSKP